MDGRLTTLGKSSFSRALAIFCLGLLLTVQPGCVGTTAQLLYFVKGDKIKAVFPGLKDQRVVVICESEASSYGPDPLSEIVTRMLISELQANIKKIELVPATDVENWKDQNGWNEIDHNKLGQDFQADMVVAVQISNYSIHEGSTMFKGRSMITSTVFDINNDGYATFVHGPDQFEFPRSHARPAIGTTEAEFERAYLTKIVQQVSWLYCDHEKVEKIAQDAWLYDLE